MIVQFHFLDVILTEHWKFSTFVIEEYNNINTGRLEKDQNIKKVWVTLEEFVLLFTFSVRLLCSYEILKTNS